MLELKDLSQLPPQVTAAIASIDITETKDSRRTIKVRMHDKMTALQMLARYLSIKGVGREVSTDSGEDESLWLTSSRAARPYPHYKPDPCDVKPK